MAIVHEIKPHGALTELEREVVETLHVQLVPGTEIMRDLTSSHFVHGKHGKHVVLVPQPHNDVHDPLNWSPRWKFSVLAVLTFYNFLGNWNTLSIGPLTEVFIAQWNLSVTQVALLTGVCILGLGYANLVIVPCLNIFGRRAPAIGLSLICVVASIWAAVATSYNSLMGARALIGLAAAYSESLMPMVIADLMFLHERGLWMGVYFTSYFGSALIGPIVSGSIVQHVSYRWYFWLATILQSLCTILLVLFFPNTKYHRGSTIEEMLRDGSVATEGSAAETNGVLAEKAGSEDDVEKPTIQHRGHADASQVLGCGYPSRRQRWTVFVGPDKREATVEMTLRHVLTPFQLVTFPIILYGAFCVAFPACALIVTSLLYSTFFAAPPYNFSFSSVGFVNFGLLAGAMFALFTAGPISDMVSARLTERNNGIKEPEMRLWSLIPWLIIGAIGMIISGVGQDHLWPWEAVIIIGYSFLGAHVIAIPAIGITYAIDSYKPVAGQILVVATVLKNSFAYGMTHYLNTWVAKDGAVPAYMTLMALSVGLPLLGMPIFIKYGKKLRIFTKDARVHTF